jgi:hypothetical protein
MKSMAAALATTFIASGSVKATLTAPTHTPKANTKWYYVLRVTQNGRPVAARITVQIVDPLGDAHAVQLGASKRNITNYPIRGTFRDYVIWPKESSGIPLTFRIIVRAGGITKIVKYSIVSRR